MATQHKRASAAGMAKAATRFVESLSGDQRDKTIYEYMDGERIFWYYPPVNRHGLPLRDMDDDQRQLAYTLMETGLTDNSFNKAKLIIEHEDVLGPLEKEAGVTSFSRDPDLYYWTVFGDPSDDSQPWGWRVEGHHISLNFSLWGDKFISMTPFFYGANPAEVRKGPKKGLRILDDRMDLGFELMNSLDKGQSSKSTIYGEAPYDIITYNSSRVSLPPEEGLPASKMNDTQKSILRKLVKTYVNEVRSDMAEEKWARLESEGFDGLHWAWGGAVDPTKEHYYRIHGGNFVVEYDNRQNGANHIHSVWRDVENDFANDVLREHLLLYHVL